MAMAQERPGIEVQRGRVVQALRTLVADRGVENITAEALARAAGVSRATFYRCFSSLDEVVEVLYDDFERHVDGRLERFLPAGSLSGDWLDGLIDQVLDDAMEMGPLLHALYREELRPGSRAADRQRRRVARQIESIARWWESATRIPASLPLVEAIILLLQASGLRLAGTQDEKDRQNHHQAVRFMIEATIARFAAEAGAEAPTPPG